MDVPESLRSHANNLLNNTMYQLNGQRMIMNNSIPDKIYCWNLSEYNNPGGNGYGLTFMMFSDEFRPYYAYFEFDHVRGIQYIEADSTILCVNRSIINETAAEKAIQFANQSLVNEINIEWKLNIH
jgi:hypothetical protein